MNRFSPLNTGFHYLLTSLFCAAMLLSCNDDDEAPVPEVTAIDPSSALTGKLISITGKDFSPVFSENKVSFNGKDALVTNASSTQLNALVPADAETGPVTVTVNGRTAVNQLVFTVESLPSVIASVHPLSGGYKTLVTITGSNFKQIPADNTVTFNGMPGIVESATPTSLTVRVPLRAGSGTVVVNGVSANNLFTYVPDIYIIGQTGDNAGYYRATYWKNGVPFTLSNTGSHTYASDMAFVGDDVYVIGSRFTGIHSVARFWKNGVEMPLGNDTNPSGTEGIFAAGSDVYIVGNEITGGKTRIVYWKNGDPVYVTDGTSTANGSGIAVNGQDVYVVGNSLHTNGNTVGTYWKNGTPTQLTTGVSFAWDIFVSGDDVYTTGSIRNTGPGVGFVSYWKNETAVLLSPGLSGGRGSDIVVVGNDVYVAGVEDNSKPVRLAKYWKNGGPVILSDGAYFASADAIDVLGDDVYVAGIKTTTGGQQTVTLWKNDIPLSITDGGSYASAVGLVLR